MKFHTMMLLLNSSQSQRNFSSKKISREIETQVAIKGTKNRQIDVQIDKVTNLQDARQLYYNSVGSFQDHHFIHMMSRLQQIINLSELKKSQKQSLLLLQSKSQEKLVLRINQLDPEDLQQLAKTLVRLEKTYQNKEFIYECYLKMVDRIRDQDFVVMVKQQFDLRTLIIFCSQMNFLIKQCLINENLITKEVEQSIYVLGQSFSEVIKASYFQTITQELPLMLLVLEQLSKLKFENYSIIKELIQKFIPFLQNMNHKQLVQILQIISRLDTEHDQKFIRTIVVLVNRNLSNLTNEELGHYLESLSILEYQSDPGFGISIVNEIEKRQLQYVQGKRDETIPKEKFNTQDAVKILRGLLHLGHSREVNRSFILWRLYTTLIGKQYEKLTTNQVHDFYFMTKQTLLNDLEPQIKSRLEQFQQDLQIQLDAKLLKFDAQKLLFLLIQDFQIKSPNKLIDNYPITQKSLRSILFNIKELTSIQELNLVAQVFTNLDQNLKLQQCQSSLFHFQKQLRDAYLAKKDFESFLDSYTKTLYLTCIMSINLKQPIQTIQQQELWQQVNKQIDSLSKLGLFKKIQEQINNSEYFKEIQRFQNMILENKTIITPPEMKIEAGQIQEQQSNPKIEKLIKNTKVQELTVMKPSQNFDVNGSQVQVDLFSQENKLGFVLQKDFAKVNIDSRFITDKTLIDRNLSHVLGKDEFTRKNSILEYCNHFGSINPIDQFALKYFHGIELKVLNFKKAKQDNYILSLIK
eukprot:403350203